MPGRGISSSEISLDGGPFEESGARPINTERHRNCRAAKTIYGQQSERDAQTEIAMRAEGGEEEGACGLQQMKGNFGRALPAAKVRTCLSVT